MSNIFNTGHVAKLHEIQSARLSRNQPGIGTEVEELIRRLTDGGVAGKTDDPRLHQAKVLHDLRFGEGKSFEEYLKDIPEQIPQNPSPGIFNRLVLVDRRLGLVKTCQCLGVIYNGDDNTLVSFYEKRNYSDVEWVWMQDGRRNQNRKPSECRKECGKGEISMTAIEGLMLYAQNRTVLDEPESHVIDLPGSVFAENRHDVACLGRWDDVVGLYWGYDDFAFPEFGSGSRSE